MAPAKSDADIISALERAAFFDPSSVAMGQELPPQVLFHFTNLSGLLGIVGAKTVWASIANSSNDAGEASYVAELAKAVIEGGELAADQPAVIKAIPFFFEPDNPPSGFRVRFHTFAASFCDTVNDASLWHVYADGGRGAAVGFSTEGLSVAPFTLVKVVYDRAQQVAIIRRVIARVLSVHPVEDLEALIDPNHRYFPITAYMAAQGILALGPLMKAPAFSSEREWRLVTGEVEMDGYIEGQQLRHTEGPIKMRTRDSRLIAYKEVHFQHLPLREVIFGASGETSPTDYAVRRLLPQVAVRRSSVLVRRD